MRTVAIMQPTFFPWQGYFGLMEASSVFVFLDSVQFDKRGWQRRNRVKTPQGPIWLTLPVYSKGRRDQKICDVEVDHSADAISGIIRTITYNYKKAKYFSKYSEDIFLILEKRHEKLCDVNVELIQYFKESLGIRCQIVKSSDLEPKGAKADLLADLCKKLAADVYLSPAGSKDYMDASDAFHLNSIEVRYNPFQPVEYPQLWGKFEPLLSILDLLFNVGPESLDCIRRGMR